MKKVLLSFILCCALSNTFAQTNIFQDDDGKSAFSVWPGSSYFLNLNVKDKQIGFVFSPDSIRERHIGLFNVSLEGKENKFPGVSKGDFTFEGKVGYTFIYYLNDINTVERFRTSVYILPEVGVSRVNVLDTLRDIKKSVFSETALNLSLQIGYNNEALFDRLVTGVAFRLGAIDNTNSLTSTKFSEIKILNISPGSVYQVGSDPKDVYFSQQYLENLFSFNGMLDVGYKFHKDNYVLKRILPMVHFRWNALEKMKPVANTGFGLYFTDKGAPLQGVFGIQYFVDDYFNVRDAEDKSKWARSSLNLVVGFKLE